jgi:hypothetical protein
MEIGAQTLVSSRTRGAAKKGRFGGVKLRGKDSIEIETYRCTLCGYLGSYASL